jgi:hypothetical protein
MKRGRISAIPSRDKLHNVSVVNYNPAYPPMYCRSSMLTITSQLISREKKLICAGRQHEMMMRRAHSLELVSEAQAQAQAQACVLQSKVVMA